MAFSFLKKDRERRRERKHIKTAREGKAQRERVRERKTLREETGRDRGKRNSSRLRKIKAQ